MIIKSEEFAREVIAALEVFNSGRMTAQPPSYDGLMALYQTAIKSKAADILYIRELNGRIKELEGEIAARGEYICPKCWLRQGSTHTAGDF